MEAIADTVTTSYCGAKNRQGSTYRRLPMANGRCAMHGGKSTGPKEPCRRNLRHGIYLRRLSDEELALWPFVPVGILDDEIKLARILLRRFVTTQNQIEADPPSVANRVGFVLREIKICAEGPAGSAGWS